MSGVLRKQAFIRCVIWADFRAHCDYVIAPYLLSLCKDVVAAVIKTLAVYRLYELRPMNKQT